MRPLNLLLVTYSFPPCGGVGVMRASSLARYFPEAEIRVDVLTARNAATVAFDAHLLDGIPSEVTVHRTLTLDLPFALKKRIKRYFSSRQAPAAASSRPEAAESAGSVHKLLQRILSPDPQVTWVPMLLHSAVSIVKRRSIDIVLITVPPFSSLLLARHLRKQFPNLPIVIDFRDEWLKTNFSLVSFLFNTSHHAYSRAKAIEAQAVSAASLVVAVTDSARQETRSRYPTQPDSKFCVIPNGFDQTSLVTHASRNDERADSNIIVTFVGTLYRSTEPSCIVQALQTLPPAISNRLTLRFIGHIEDPQYREMLLNLGSMVELRGFLPQREALALMDQTDYVLLINHDPLNVGGKFYDYVGAGKPVLGAVHPQGDTRRLLDELRAGWWAADTDVEGIRQLFVDAAMRGHPPFADFHPDHDKIASYERRALARRYAQLLHSIARSADTPAERVDTSNPNSSEEDICSASR